MGHIRPLAVDDLPQVLDLNTRLLSTGVDLLPETQYDMFYNVCFHNPWYDPEMSSLVYQENGGKITGFLGVIPRGMSVNGQPVRMAVSHHLMVDPDSRSTLAGVQLLRTFLKGPQDLSIADKSNNTSRKIWEKLGGTTSLLYSLYWYRPLRPCCFALNQLSKDNIKFRTLTRISMPICRTVDAVVSRIPRSPFRYADPGLPDEDPTVETLLECINQCAEKQWLWPDYDVRSLRWVLDVMSQDKRFGILQKVVIRNEKRDIIGWYLYYLNRGGMSTVLQLGVMKQAIDDVLDHLFYHAWQQGATGLVGRLEPRLMQTGTRKFGFVMPGRHWALVHTRCDDLLGTINSGKAFLSYLEGEM